MGATGTGCVCLSLYAFFPHKSHANFTKVVNPFADENHGTSEFAHGRQYAPLLCLMPHSYSKVVHFVRHGEGWHNVGLPNRDAQLTPKGWQQAHALGSHMKRYPVTREVQLVVVSPLMRALETAAGAFGSLGDNDRLGSPILMTAQNEVRDVCTAHETISCRPGIKYLVNEACRERLSTGLCDARSDRCTAKTKFPGFDFSMVKSEKDDWWKPGNLESEAEVVLRGRRFLQWLMTLPETNIAVVTHSAFLWFTLLGFGVEFSRPVRQKLQKWYENCEMRTVVLGDGGATMVGAPTAGVQDTDFAGGHAAAEPQQELMETEPSINGNLPRQ